MPGARRWPERENYLVRLNEKMSSGFIVILSSGSFKRKTTLPVNLYPKLDHDYET